jgi:hypothetical protein
LAAPASRTRSLAGGQLGRLQLEGHGHIAALAAARGKVAHKVGKAIQRHQGAVVADGLAGQLGKAGMNPGERLWATGLPMTQ